MRLKVCSLLLPLGVSLLLLSGCNKTNDSTPAPTIINTWTVNGSTITAGYSDMITKAGYTLIFHPLPSAHLEAQIKFIFPQRPKGTQTYQVAADTNKAQQVIVQLKTNSGSYYSSVDDTARVWTSVIENKLYLSGFNLNLQQDSLPGSRAIVSFNLTEF
ncbi:MAG: hypothetical protein JST36_05490 [Bacteroidetes bacterium]|nr:hypothetical protein [Bacteroidota bacterium]